MSFRVQSLNAVRSWLMISGITVIASGPITSNAWAQGGGNANSVGLALESAVESSASGGPGRSSTPSSGGRGEPADAPVGRGGTPSGPPSSGGRGEPSDAPVGRGVTPSGPPGGYEDDGSGNYDMGMGGYNSGGMGYGASGQTGGNGAQRAQISAFAMMNQAALGLASFFRSSSLEEEAKARTVSLWEEAALAFHQGDQKKALALYYAHIVSDGDDANEARSAVEYSRLLKRPVWAVRFGISVHPRIPDSLVTDPQPIREGMAVAGPRSRNRGMAPADGGSSDEGFGGRGGNGGGPPDGADFGQDAGMAMDSGMGDEFGERSGAPAPKKIITTLGGAGTEEVKKTLDRNLGLLADVTSTLFSARFDNGRFGRAFDRMAAPGAELASVRDYAGDGTPSDLPMWIPGVDYVGEGPVAEMTSAAKRSEIDVLLHFDVVVKENRLGTPSYAARCKLVHVETGETLGVSKSVDKAEIASGTVAVREAVVAQMTNLFEIIDKKVSVEPMPALQAGHAAARIEALLGSTKAGSMRSLAEVMMFRTRDLITPDQLDQVFQFAGGEDGLRLLHDEITSRYATVTTLVDRELNKEASK